MPFRALKRPATIGRPLRGHNPNREGDLPRSGGPMVAGRFNARIGDAHGFVRRVSDA